jgi:hypothetical protein
MASSVGRGLLDVFTLGTAELLPKNLLKTPSPPESPPEPTTDSKATQAAIAEASAKRSRARGFRSTILNTQDASSGNTSTGKLTYGS